MPQSRQHLARLIHAHRARGDRLLRNQAIERPEQLAHGRDRQLRHRREHLGSEVNLPLGDAARQDRQARLVVWRTDVDHQATGKPPDQALVERLDLLRGPISGQHNLSIGGHQQVDQSQQFGLQLALIGEQLRVVDQHQVRLGEPAPVRFGLTRRERRVICLDKVVDGDVLHDARGIDREGFVADRHEEMGLAQARPGVEEEWIVRRARGFGDGLGRRGREAIRRAHHERGESGVRVQHRELTRQARAAGRIAASRW
jgi:hypothetical protein